MSIDKIYIPDIGDFSEVEIIEVLIAEGDKVEEGQSLITLESDKASMEIPTPKEGVVKSLKVKLGDKVSKDSLILELETADVESKGGEGADLKDSSTAKQETNQTAEVDTESNLERADKSDNVYDVAVLGSGPGGYTAAFRAADLGLKVALIERFPIIGGVCLNVGCIPSKALLHMAQVVCEAKEMSENGVDFGKPKLSFDQMRGFKNKVINKLTGGLQALAKQRKVDVIEGYGKFIDAHTIVVEGEKNKEIHFKNAIVAAGSRVQKMDVYPWQDERIMDSTDALELEKFPKKLLVVGAGIIGLEMATVYESFGSEVTVTVRSQNIFSGAADKDIVNPLLKRMKKRIDLQFGTVVKAVDATGKRLKVTLEDDKGERSETFDKILVATGRIANGLVIDSEKAGVVVNENGVIPVDHQMRTNVAHIFAIGDIVPGPMLAHKATHEGKVAAEVIAGLKSGFNAMTIPSVAYTNPEVAWMGKTETECKKEGIEYTKGAFPWAASGRSLSINNTDGLTKLLFDKKTGRLLGAGIVGPNAGELIAEAVVSMEMGATAEDIGLSIHPHPTLSETLCFAAEMAEGTITDLMPPRKR